MATSQVGRRGAGGSWQLFLAAGAVILVAASAALTAQASVAVRALVGKTMSGTVTSIVDGDTIHVSLGNTSTVTVRLDGIDTPERGEPFSAQATRATRVLLFTKTVALTGTDVDRYGRLVARIHVGGLDVSEELVHEGLACHFTRYSSDPMLANAAEGGATACCRLLGSGRSAARMRDSREARGASEGDVRTISWQYVESSISRAVLQELQLPELHHGICHRGSSGGGRLQAGRRLSEVVSRAERPSDGGWPRTGRPVERGAVTRDERSSASTRWGCSRTGPAVPQPLKSF